MAINSDVTADDVRTELNEVDQDAISTDVIEQKITDAEIIVGQYAADDADPAAIGMAVRRVAALDAITSDSGGWQTVAAELQVREEYNVEGMVAELHQKVNTALAIIAPDGGGPSLHSLGERYP